MASFGPAVSQYLSNATSLSATGTYLIVNSETNVDGYLTAIELYATDAGSITVFVNLSFIFLIKNKNYFNIKTYLKKIKVKRTCPSGQSASFQNPNICTNSSAKSIYNCSTGTFSTITQSCSNDVKPKYNLITSTTSFTQTATFTLNLEAGYNIFTESTFGKIFMESGSYLVISQTAGSGQVALTDAITDTALPIYDMIDTSFVSLNKRFYIRSYVSYKKQMGIYNLYSSPGN